MENHSDYVLYYVEFLSDELKAEIRNRLSSICHGADQARSTRKTYSYKETVKEFIKRYKTANDKSKDRKKGMIGELLTHVFLEIEGRFIPASPFFNLEERSFKKGYDVVLFDGSANELWIAEVKSGEKQERQLNASSSIVGLINTAKNDLQKRLNEQDTSLWLNAIHAAKVSMSSSNSQKDAVVNLLEQCSDNAVDGRIDSRTFNVMLTGVLFHTMSEKMDEAKVKGKQKEVEKKNLFKRVVVVAIQKNTYEAVYRFLESEASANEE